MMPLNVDAVQSQLAELARTAIGIPVEEQSYSASELITLAARPKVERLTSARAALGLAAYEVGKTIVALAGWEWLHKILDLVEERAGSNEAEWVSRRWTGLSGPCGEIWSD